MIKRYQKFFESKVLKNYKHGTSSKVAKIIKNQGFVLGTRNAIYFAPPNSTIFEIYGIDAIITVDIQYNKSITFDEVRSNIVPLLKSKNKKMDEPNINKELLKMGYDIIFGHNEVAVLNLKNITIKSIEKY